MFWYIVEYFIVLFFSIYHNTHPFPLKIPTFVFFYKSFFQCPLAIVSRSRGQILLRLLLVLSCQSEKKAKFYDFQVNRLKSQKKEAKVPLPPSFGYGMDDSGDEEEDGPPGMAPLKKLPALKFDKPFTKVVSALFFNFVFPFSFPDNILSVCR